MDSKLKVIREFSHDAWDELEDASNYAELACSWKSKDNTIADMYMDLASEELNHFQKIWSAANKYIEEFAEDDAARYVWEWQSEDLMDRHVLVTSRMSQF